MTVRVLALNVACHACGETAQVQNLDDAWQRHQEPGGMFFASHQQPEIVSAVMDIGGRLTLYRVAIGY